MADVLVSKLQTDLDAAKQEFEQISERYHNAFEDDVELYKNEFHNKRRALKFAQEAVESMAESESMVHGILDKVPMENLPSDDELKAMEADPGMAAYLQLSVPEDDAFSKRAASVLEKSAEIDTLVDQVSNPNEEPIAENK